MMCTLGLLCFKLLDPADSMYFSASEGRFPLALEEPPDTVLEGASSSSLSQMSNQIDLFGFDRPAVAFFLRAVAFLAFVLPPGLVLSLAGAESSVAPGLPVEILEDAISSPARVVGGSEPAAGLAMLADLRVRLPTCISIFAP